VIHRVWILETPDSQDRKFYAIDVFPYTQVPFETGFTQYFSTEHTRVPAVHQILFVGPFKYLNLTPMSQQQATHGMPTLSLDRKIVRVIRFSVILSRVDQ